MTMLRPLARVWAGLLGCTVIALSLGLAARFVIPRGPWAAAPALLAASPPDGATTVLPRSTISLTFSAPMNRAAVNEALRIDPPIAGNLVWSADATALTFRPSAPLTPNITYTVSLDTSALGRWWRPLERPAAVRFRTAPQPAVVAALPNSPGIPPDASLAVVFDQPMVPPEAVGPSVVPPLQFTPPISPTARWLDQRTLLIRPATPLAAATVYTATIGPDLADLRGVELGAPFSWSFSTAWPTVLERTPAPETRWVSRATPLVLRLDAPLDLELLRRSLRIEPPVDGELAAAIVGATQVITFTPSGGWAFDTSYRVSLIAPPGSGLAAPPTAPWSFEVEPRPRLAAIFPGQGQLLAPGQPIRLVFSTPQDADSLRAGLSIEPPVAELPLSVNETEVRLTPELRPSTTYTVTVAAGTLDRSGEPLADAVQVRLRTAPARPALEALAAFRGVVTLPVSQSAVVDLAATNLSALDLSLYRLDQATLLLALDLGPQNLRQFRPERYGQTLARAWRVTRSDPLDEPVRLSLPVGLNDGEPLAPGAYYLRALSPEGPRSDLLLLVSSSTLALRQGPESALVWATDAASGEPLPAVPVALYRDGARLAAGVTAADGTFVQPVARGGGQLVAITDAGGLAVVRADWRSAAPAPQPAVGLIAFADRASYAPGATVQISGVARSSSPGGDLALPPALASCRLQLRGPADLPLTPGAVCSLEPASGQIAGQLALPATLPPGDYRVAVQLGDGSVTIPLVVRAQAESRPLELTVLPAAERLAVTASVEGLPLAGSVVSWTLRLEPLSAPPAPPGFILTPPEPPPASLSGEAVTDAAGTFELGLLPGGPAALARRYVLEVSSPGSPPLLAEQSGLIPPGETLVALSLSSRIVPNDRRSAVELLALDGLGQPVPGARLELSVFREGDDIRPLISRFATAAPDGRASVELVQLSPGPYRVVASANGGPPTDTPLYVYGNRFAGWPAGDGEVAVVTDRDRYRPGEVATLLVAAPEPVTNLLLTVERGGLLRSQVSPLRAGQVITLPISPEMAPGVSLGAITADGSGRRFGATTIAVERVAPPIAVSLAADRGDYLPSDTATLTVTVADGSPLAAGLLVTAAPDLGEGGLYASPPLNAAPAGPSTAAALPPAPAPAPGLVNEPRPALPGVALPLTGPAGAPGAQVAQVVLPSAEGRWRLTAYVPEPNGEVVAATTVVTVSRPLVTGLIAPAVLRPGDRVSVTLALRNTGPLTQELRLRLAAVGAELDNAATVERTVTLAPRASTRERWALRPAAGASEATLRLTVASPARTEALVRTLPVAAAVVSRPGPTFVPTGPLAATLELPPDAVELRLAVAPSLRAALADQATALAARADPSTDERAALVLIASGLARSAEPAERLRYQQLAREALAALAAAQNGDGGWGWWVDTPSDPFVTGFVVEAQAAARVALQTSPANLRAVSFLRQALPATDPDLAAYLGYALARAGSAPPAAIPASTGLSADSLAFLALSLPPAQAGPLLDRLAALAVQGQAAPGELATVSWFAEGPAALPRSPAAVSAAAFQAIAPARPDSALLPGAERTLLAAWGVDGWGSGYEAARVAAALLDRSAPSGGGPVALIVAGESLIAGGPFTDTVRVARPAAGLGPQPTLSVQAAGPASYLVASATTGAGGALSDATIAVDQELVDPNDGTPLSPNAVRLGQLVAIRITAVVPQPLLRADLQVALPGGLEPLPPTLRSPFLHVDSMTSGTLTLSAASLRPGVYTQTVVARAVAPGRFEAPPARLVAAFEPGLAAQAPVGLAVTISE